MAASIRPGLPPDLTVKEGWREFVEAPKSNPPRRPTPAEWKAMTVAEREAFDHKRLIHHSSFGPIATPTMKRIHAALSLQAQSNLHHPPGARPGSVIDGEADIGKTTILSQFGRLYERTVRKQYPSDLTETGDEFLPALYVTLAAGTTVKGLSKQMLEFYAYPYARTATQVELTMQVQKVARRCQTTLFQFDDIHYLKLGNQSDREVNDHLKHLASIIPATFIYAGIDCEEAGLLREGKSRMHDKAFSQTGSRFSLHRIKKFRIDTEADARDWIALVKAIEAEIVLMQSFDGMLSDKLWRYLFERTHGEIGSLTSLIRQGALLAIQTGKERLTANLLDEIRLSYDAETERQRRRTRNRSAAQLRGRTRIRESRAAATAAAT